MQTTLLNNCRTPVVKPSPLRLGLILPGILIVFIIVDAALRFMPIDGLVFRPWEAMTRFNRPGMPFQPNKSLLIPKSYGDLSNMANLPTVRDYRAERFTTDSFGFRNPPGDTRIPQIVIAGDSFAVGASLDDSETLSYQLMKLSGTRVYNAAGVGYSCQPPIINRLGMSNGLVVIEVVERLLPTVTLPPAPVSQIQELPWKIPRCRWLNLRLAALHESCFSQWNFWQSWLASRKLVGRVNQLMALSPLSLMGQKLINFMENDLILPRTASPIVVVQKLLNADNMLFFLPDDMNSSAEISDNQVNYWVEQAAIARQMKNSLLVLIVPDKSSVYDPLSEHESVSQFKPKTFAHQLEMRLREKNISVLNLTNDFCQAAKDGLYKRQYIYCRDDTHWSPLGAKLAAKRIWQWWHAKEIGSTSKYGGTG